MDIFKFISSIEELIYEILLLVLFIPKTLFHITFSSPAKFYKYVKDEFEKEEGKRFAEYTSPLLLFIIVIAIPTAYLAYSQTDIIYTYPWLKEVSAIERPSIQLYAFCIALYLLLYPLLVSAIIYKFFYPKKLSKYDPNFKTTLYSQCYCFIPTHILALIIHIVQMKSQNQFIHNDWVVGGFYLLFLFFIFWREVKILKEQLPDKFSGSHFMNGAKIIGIMFTALIVFSAPYIIYFIFHYSHMNISFLKPITQMR